MDELATRFAQLLEEVLIPHFCSNESKGVSPRGFRGDASRVSECDQLDFLRGWDAQLLVHQGGSLYRADGSKKSEQFFWEGPKNAVSRTYTLWLEPIITLGVLARLHLDYGWPRELIGTQSQPNGEFDALTRRSRLDSSLRLAAEVKKSPREVDELLRQMHRFCRDTVAREPFKAAEKNAFRKVQALRRDKPEFFWAIGPDRYESLFSINYLSEGVIEFTPVSQQALKFDTGRS